MTTASHMMLIWFTSGHAVAEWEGKLYAFFTCTFLLLAKFKKNWLRSADINEKQVKVLHVDRDFF